LFSLTFFIGQLAGAYEVGTIHSSYFKVRVLLRFALLAVFRSVITFIGLKNP
jgi:hypothetical protein